MPNNNNKTRLRGSEIELEWHNSVRFGSSRVRYVVYNTMALYPTRTHTHTHTSVRLSVRPSVCLCARFFTRKGRRLLIKTRAPPIIAGHYTFARCGHPARRIISHRILYHERPTHADTHTSAHKRAHAHGAHTERFIESSLSTRPGNRDLLAAVYTTSHTARGRGYIYPYVHAHVQLLLYTYV